MGFYYLPLKRSGDGVSYVGTSASHTTHARWGVGERRGKMNIKVVLPAIDLYGDKGGV